MLGISYWKFHCAETIQIPYELSPQEAEFWNTVYQKGLGEFFYKNKLNPQITPTFPFKKNRKPGAYSVSVHTEQPLVGIGGGKESIVAVELLKQGGFKPTAFIVDTNNKSGVIDSVVKEMGIESLKIQRALDPKAFEDHPYNGHVPISAVYAFLGMFTAIVYGYPYVIVGNEHSSNFGNVIYKGLDINHQWSKSFEFETLFQEYVKKFLTKNVLYFSLLRPFHEIRIAQMFSKIGKQYFPVFSSCNRNFSSHKSHVGLWCGECPKCIFTFTLLSAFIPKKELVNIFGKNLYQEEKLLPLFKDILGIGAMKPFDCVGTFEETQEALLRARKYYKNDSIVSLLCDKMKGSQDVFKTNTENAVPKQFKALGMENVLILGYGKEGRATEQYVRKYYPVMRIRVGDQTLDKDYLKKQHTHDIAIKTPGIHKDKVTIPYTTATNIFFSHTKGKNFIIGITGSKGKSTTSSLVYHILKTAGKDVQLFGNIGKPMLLALVKPIPKGRIFVLELSSAQLDDSAYSPDIAVVTNLFPEHMDYHGNLQNYYAAKKNIINFQSPKNYFVYNQKTKHWLKDYKGKAVPFSKKLFKSNLIGEHNKSNIAAAVAVAEILKIPQKKIAKAIASFKGLEHRLELVGEYRGIRFYDDAISTTPDSTILAIKTLKKVDTIFLGGQDRGYDFSQLEKVIKQYKIKNVVLFPDSGPHMIKNKSGLNILKTKNMKEAVQFAYTYTRKGKICILSCASPSYSLWKNFEQKGDEFKKFVKKLA